jgi:CHASE2 domain-containing sensor protein
VARVFFSASALRQKRLRYWITASFILVLSFAATPFLYNMLNLSQTRAQLTQFLLELDPRPLVPRFVKVVLVEDDEYWAGYPAGRRPIKRDYLARLIDKLVDADARVIALDFDIRLPDPEHSPLEVPFYYKQETDELIHSIVNAALKRKKSCCLGQFGRMITGIISMPMPMSHMGFALVQIRMGSGKTLVLPNSLSVRKAYA